MSAVDLLDWLRVYFSFETQKTKILIKKQVFRYKINFLEP